MDHLAYSTAVLIAARSVDVNTAFATEFDAGPNLDAVISLAGEELAKVGAAVFEVLAAEPVGGVFGGLAWTIFRPSVIYGPGDKSVNALAKMVRRLPVVPVLGNGRAKVQPVAVEVVARAFVAAAHNDRSVGQTYDLCGPVAFTWNELSDQLAVVLGVRKPKLHLPLPVARVAAAVCEKLLKQPPFTRDQLLMTAEDNVGNPQPAERDLLLEQEPFTVGLRRYLA